MTCDDEIALAIFGGILFWPAMLLVFLLWEFYVANAIDRMRVRVIRALGGHP